jgi:serine O-acetyltransferase
MVQPLADEIDAAESLRRRRTGLTITRARLRRTASQKLGHQTLVSRCPGAVQAFTEVLRARLRREAEEALERTPMLAPLFLDSVLNQHSFETAMIHRVASRLRNDVITLPLIVQAFNRALEADPEIAPALRTDIIAVYEFDPACERFIEPFLYFKGFHAIQAHRLTRWLWLNGDRDFCEYLQSRSSEVFQTDIHPAARFGRGLFLDHATGLVVGETAVVGDDVTIQQDVTLGGTGTEAAERHPKIGSGVIIGAGAKILGNIGIGDNARVAAGSVVLRPVPARATVAGVPARVVRIDPANGMARPMDQILLDLAQEAFVGTI